MSGPLDPNRIDRTTTTLFDALRQGSGGPEVVERTKVVVWVTPPPELPVATPTKPAAAPPSGAPSHPRAEAKPINDEAIRREWQRIRPRWEAEHGVDTETTVHHEHHHHLHDNSRPAMSGFADGDVIDAEVIADDFVASEPSALPSATAQGALGRHKPDPIQSKLKSNRKRSRS